MKDRAIQLNDTQDEGVPFDLKVDVKKDLDGKIISGLVIGSTLQQNKALILLVNPGELKEYPTLGVGFISLLLSEDFLFIRHTIRQNFSKDDLNITELDLYSVKNIKIEANY
jgi:hypothetical protein